MSAESTPLPFRISDAERERSVRGLARSTVDGRLSVDTFSRRVERAYTSRTRGELEDLASDLPHRSRTVRFMADVAYRIGSARFEIERAWNSARTPRLALPDTATCRVVIGRGPTCDCVVADQSVSRRHATLLLRDGQVTIEDLGSLNGTRINGRRVVVPTEVRAGDVVSFGAARFTLC